MSVNVYNTNIDHKLANILIVDDERTNVILLTRILTAAGFENVEGTQDPQQVYQLFMEKPYDLILLDLNMPIVNGYMVMEQLQSQTERDVPPILVLTAQDIQSYRQKAFDLGARDYVTKPFDNAELLSRVKNLLEVQMAQKYICNQNAILEEKVRERTQDIYDVRLKIVRHLGRAAEYRDNETGLHIIRMSKISALIGKAFGLSESECELLLHAAPMHDIGKIGIPDSILLKPGKLNAVEWEIMKTHTQIGSDILAGDDYPLMNMAREIAISHHEKWNGKGYPFGLSGDDIPIVGRIAALADVFDALTSKRPYKEAWETEKAIDLIAAESGKHFDPELVELFMENINEILLIMEKYAEPTEDNNNNNVRMMN